MQVQKRAQQRHFGSQPKCRRKTRKKPRSPLHKRTPLRRRVHSPLQMRRESHRKPQPAKYLKGQMPPNAGNPLPPPQEMHKMRHRIRRRRLYPCHDRAKHKLLWKTDLLPMPAQKRQPTQRHKHRQQSQIRKRKLLHNPHDNRESPLHRPYDHREIKQQNCQLLQILLHIVQRK